MRSSDPVISSEFVTDYCLLITDYFSKKVTLPNPQITPRFCVGDKEGTRGKAEGWKWELVSGGTGKVSGLGFGALRRTASSPREREREKDLTIRRCYAKLFSRTEYFHIRRAF
jgi:hypothetical protein